MPPASTTHAQAAARVVVGGCGVPPASTTHAQEAARVVVGGVGCGVWGGLSGPGPVVRAAREAAGGARPPGGYPGGSSSGPRSLHA